MHLEIHPVTQDLRLQKFANGTQDANLTSTDISDKERGDLIDVVIVNSSTEGLSIYLDGELSQNEPTATNDFTEALADVSLGSFLNGFIPNFFIVKELIVVAL